MNLYRSFLLSAALLGLLAIVPTGAQSPPSTKNPRLEQELVHTEFGFYEAWKAKNTEYFRTHIPENGVFWGEDGTFSRVEEIEEQQAAAKNCTVEGYSLSDFGVLPLSTGAYLLTYKAEQYATCGGLKVPVHMNGSSVYIFKQGHWQAIYRAEVPMKNQ